MKGRDVGFFEKYKKLDRMCCDFLTVKGGVSEYIRQMDAAARGPYMVPSWQEDHKKLKRLRRVRNKIAHEASVKVISTKEDMADLSAFCGRMSSGKDPLSLLAKAEMRKRGRRKGFSKSAGGAGAFCVKLLVAVIFMGILLFAVLKLPILSVLGLQ